MLRSPPSAPRHHDPTRDSIIANSSKGWASPSKRNSTNAQSLLTGINKALPDSPRKQHPRSPSPIPFPETEGEAEQEMRVPNKDAGDGPRRTSSSFMHLRGNSLVSNSIFKSVDTGETKPISVYSGSASANTIHIKAKVDSPTTPRKTSNLLSGIGLGISASSPRRSSGRKSSSSKSKSREEKGNGSPVTTPSSERKRVSGNGERRASGGALQTLDHLGNGNNNSSSHRSERSRDDDLPALPLEREASPDTRSSSGTRKPKQSTGLKGLAKAGYVSKSPFLKHELEGEEGVSPTKQGQGGRARADSPLTLGSSTGSGAHYTPTKRSPPRQPEQGDVFSPNTTIKIIGSGNDNSPIYKDRLSHYPRNESPLRSRGNNGPPDLIPFPTDETHSLRSEHSLTNSSSNTHINPLTPTKSSITKRRIHGPRLSNSESPTAIKQAKTVTFQAVPDVKEFETESCTDGDKSRDSSEGYEEEESENIDLGEEEDLDVRGRMEDVGNGGGDLDYGNHGNGYAGSARTQIAWRDEGVRAEEDRYIGLAGPRMDDPRFMESPATSEGNGESMTANFIDSLVEDGLFSPPHIAQPRMQSISPSDEEVDGLAKREPNQSFGTTPKLDTPSFGACMSFDDTPTEEKPPVLGAPLPLPRLEPERDSAGIPYGRSHHAEREAEAHKREAVQPVEHIDQPAIPRVSGVPMMRSADVTQPAIPLPQQKRQSSYQGGQEPSVHQDGQFIDPFVTIQTATNVYADAQESRQEDGAPLGRSSHSERARVARLLATQQLGLGMPNNPAQPRMPNLPTTGRRQISYGESESGSDIGDGDSDIEYSGRLATPPPAVPVREGKLDTPPKKEELSERRPPVSEKLSALLSPTTTPAKRGLPKPPPPKPIEVPSPKSANASFEEPAIISTATKSMFGLSLPFSLPNIGTSSPLMASPLMHTSESEPIKSGNGFEGFLSEYSSQSTSALDSDRRILDFNFDSNLDLDSALSPNADSRPKAEIKPVAKLIPRVSTEPLVINKRSSTLPLQESKGDFGLAPKLSSDALGAAGAEGSTGRVRQRISRDVIRAKMEERKAVQSMVKSDDSDSDEDLGQIVQAKSLKPSEKALPTLPNGSTKIPAGKLDSVPMSRGSTTPGNLEKRSSMPLLDRSKSALDQLVSDFHHTSMEDSPSLTFTRPESLVVRHMSSESVLTIDALRTGLPSVKSSSLQRISEMSTSDDRTGETSLMGSLPIVEGSDQLKRRRSVSTGDVKQISRQDKATNRMSILSSLDDLQFKDNQSMLSAIENELQHLKSDRPYRVREQSQTIYAKSDDKVKHTGAGDVDSGRAWRQLRKASDMNQYAKELKALKAKAQGANKSFGTIFVKVLGIESLSLPLPDQPAAFCITLDNGIDYIRTPYATLQEGARVNQEFALVEHANFEFSLGLEIRRDPQIIQMLHSNVPKPIRILKPIEADNASCTSAVSRGGLRHLFGSPRKLSKTPRAMMNEVVEVAPPPVPENLCHYFPPGESTVGKTHIAFKPIAKNCDTRLLEIRYPMFGYLRKPDEQSVAAQRSDRPASHPPSNGKAPEVTPIRKQVCKITLQIFKLPALPGLTQDQLPQSIDECLRGMRHHSWHEHEYHEGLLTQKGGDSHVPRRREFKIVGGNLVARNAVTKKTVFSIDLRKVTSVIDENDIMGGRRPSTPGTPSRLDADFDLDSDTMPRSFRLIFDDGDDVLFWADTDEEKAGWLKVLNSLIGKIPSNPLWAELLSMRYRQLKARAAARKTSSSTISSPPPAEAQLPAK